MDLLKKVVSDYDVFCSIAEKLEWIEIKEEHEDWFKKYPLGIFVDLFAFPEGYIQNNLVDAYVRAVLSSMAFAEQWDKDFWDMPQKERKKALIEGQRLYQSYAIVSELRWIERDWEYLVKEIEYFATRNEIPVSEQKKYIDKLKNAKVIEIGGCCDSSVYIAIKNNLLLMVDCGFWD